VIARFLSEQSKVIQVNYPGLGHSPYHSLAKLQFAGKYGGLLTISLRDKAQCFRFINQLKLIRRATNINDNKSLVIHPASTIYCEYDQPAREEMGVSEALIRLSIGIEAAADLLADIGQALEAV